MIELRTITRDDWETCIDLKVARHQAHFVASNLYSLAQSRFLPGFRAVGIHHGGRMVGFALYGPDADDGHYWLYRLMIDRRYGARGMAAPPCNGSSPACAGRGGAAIA